MKFLSLQLENWKSYKGSLNSIDFANSKGSEITIIRAKNGFGKTSILQAFFFVLYGSVSPSLSAGTNTETLEDFPNKSALSSGQEFTTSISLVFEHEGIEWLLRREFKVNSSAGRIILGSVQKSLTQVGKGYGLANDEIDNFVNDHLLNRQVSHFYFFNGMLLEEIQSQLTRKDQLSRNLVMRSVEDALGLRFLDHLSQNLESCLDLVDAGIASQERALNKNETLLKQIADETDKLIALNQDLERLNELKQVQEAKRDQHDARLMSINPITKERALERTVLQLGLIQQKNDLEKAEERVKACAEIAWLGPLAGRLSEMYAEKEASEAEDATARRDYSALERKIHDLKTSAAKKSCQLCGHDHDPVKIGKILTEIAMLEEKIANIGVPKNADTSMVFKLGKALADSKNLGAVKEALRARDEIVTHIAGATGKISKINDLLGNFSDDINIKWEENQRAAADEEARRCQGQFDGQKRIRDTLVIALNANRAKLTDNSSVSQKDRETRTLLDILITAINQSFDNFRDRMRAQVETKATEYLRVLTSEPEVYDSVEISSDYQIKVKSPTGATLQITNSAHKQILTTAFVSAMAAVSSERTPFVLDTAFGYLDPENSNSLLKWAKYVDQQVVFLVNPKELSRELAREVLGGSVGRDYEITRAEAEVNEIREVSA